MARGPPLSARSRQTAGYQAAPRTRSRGCPPGDPLGRGAARDLGRALPTRADCAFRRTANEWWTEGRRGTPHPGPG
eukprot:3939233-Prorocentrum_lima.AAC.1